MLHFNRPALSPLKVTNSTVAHHQFVHKWLPPNDRHCVRNTQYYLLPVLVTFTVLPIDMMLWRDSHEIKNSQIKHIDDLIIAVVACVESI